MLHHSIEESYYYYNFISIHGNSGEIEQYEKVNMLTVNNICHCIQSNIYLTETND